jgi:hypothetical protein
VEIPLQTFAIFYISNNSEIANVDSKLLSGQVQEEEVHGALLELARRAIQELWKKI